MIFVTDARGVGLISRMKNMNASIPEFCSSHWLLRVPLATVFIQQGFAKIPVIQSDADAFGLPFIVWFFVAWGEAFSGIGLLFGGSLKWYRVTVVAGDMLTRFCGIVICGIMTGVILVGEPDSFLDVFLHDNFHVMLYFGGLYFALRGNRAI